jgi:hypothetical protein
MTPRVLAFAAGAFYVFTGGWAFLFPSDFYSIVATFSPYNVHLLHDAGAFQVGLGVVLIVASVAGRGLVPALIGVLAGSTLHVVAHLADIHLGGHPGTDLPALILIAAALAVALVLELRRRPKGRS